MAKEIMLEDLSCLGLRSSSNNKIVTKNVMLPSARPRSSDQREFLLEKTSLLEAKEENITG